MGNPVVPAPCSWTPARPTSQVTTVGRRGPTHIQPRRLSTRGNFGAQSHGIGTGCLRFAVRLTPPHARLASYVFTVSGMEKTVISSVFIRYLSYFIYRKN